MGAQSPEDRPKFPVGVNVFVVRDGKLLLGERANTAGDGQWGLPGGHVEDGEFMEDTAKRELFEEANLHATQFRFCGLVNQPRRKYHYIQVGMQALDAKGEVTLKEPELCRRWDFFDLHDLPKELFFGHETLIELFNKGELFLDDSEYRTSHS